MNTFNLLFHVWFQMLSVVYLRIKMLISVYKEMDEYSINKEMVNVLLIIIKIC